MKFGQGRYVHYIKPYDDRSTRLAEIAEHTEKYIKIKELLVQLVDLFFISKPRAVFSYIRHAFVNRTKITRSLVVLRTRLSPHNYSLTVNPSAIISVSCNSSVILTFTVFAPETSECNCYNRVL